LQSEAPLSQPKRGCKYAPLLQSEAPRSQPKEYASECASKYASFSSHADGTTTDRSLPDLVRFPDRERHGVTAISAGAYHSLFLQQQVRVLAVGCNTHGQLGDGTTNDRSVPVPWTLPPDIVACVVSIAAGHSHNLALLSSGVVLATGFNYFGQLGDGTSMDRPSAIAIPGVQDCKAIAAGSFSSYFLLASGAVQAVGRNHHGQLGDGTNQDRMGLVSVLGVSDARALAAGYMHALFLTVAGSVKAVGGNAFGQLGDGTTNDRSTAVDAVLLGDLTSSVSGNTSIVALVAGVASSLFLAEPTTTNHSGVVGIGYNLFGGLGDGTSTHRTQLVALVQHDAREWRVDHGNSSELRGGPSASQSESRSNWSEQYNDHLSEREPVVKIAAGAAFSIFLSETGHAMVAGRPDSFHPEVLTPTGYQLTVTNVVAVSAGTSHALFLLSTGFVKSSGQNFRGQLGDGTQTNTGPRETVDVREVSGVADVAAGWIHSVFLLSNGRVMSCGGNQNGQLGDGTTTDRTIAVYALVSEVVAIATKAVSTLFLLRSGQCKGTGATYQDGNVTPVDIIGVSDAVALTASWSVMKGHSVYVLATGFVKANGWNDGGQLGDGTTTPRPVAVDVTNVSDVVAASAGTSHTLFLLSSGFVKACGANDLGQLGDGSTTQRLVAVDVAGVGGIRAIAAGNYHSLFLDLSGNVASVGSNDYGQLGTGFRSNGPTTQVIAIAPTLEEPPLNVFLESLNNLGQKTCAGSLQTRPALYRFHIDSPATVRFEQCAPGHSYIRYAPAVP